VTSAIVPEPPTTWFALQRAIFPELDADKEHFLVLALNNKNRINVYKVISTGTLTASLIRPGDVYGAALHLAAAAVVFLHNHSVGRSRAEPRGSGNYKTAQRVR